MEPTQTPQWVPGVFPGGKAVRPLLVPWLRTMVLYLYSLLCLPRRVTGRPLPLHETVYDQRNAQVFNLFIYLLLPYMFRAFF
jgi:hypothetical protein